MNREEIIWAAGLFEGEGCFVAPTNRGSSFCASLVSTDEDVLRRFAAAVGVGSVSMPRKLEGRKQVWKWSVSRFEHFQYVVALLWQWLGERRRARATEILGSRKGVAPGKHAKPRSEASREVYRQAALRRYHG